MKKLLIIAALAALSAPSYAEQWQILGTRPMGMGGAFVAVAQGPIAQYWNPAGLVKSKSNVSGMEIPVGVNAEFTGNIVENASQIGDLAEKYSAIQTAQTSGGAINAEQAAAFVKTLSLMGDMNEPGKGVLFELAGGLNIKFSKVAFSVNNFTSIGLNPFIDTVNIGLGVSGALTGVNFNTTNEATLIDGSYSAPAATIKTAIDTIGFSSLETLFCGAGGCTASGGPIDTSQKLANVIVNQAIAAGLTVTQVTEAAATMAEYAASVQPIVANASDPSKAYTNNTSNLTVAGASFLEIAGGYAWDIKFLSGLSLGANLKLINGRTAYSSFRFLSESDTKDAFSLEDTKSSWKPAADLGLLWDVRQKYPKFPLKPRVGLVMRNINSPGFDTTAGGDYKLNRQARLGFALNPANFWTLALDMDLTKNKTPVNGFDSRQLAMGTEINIVNRKAFNIPLRAGLLKNMAESDSKAAYTLGTGINLLHMHFDVSGVFSSGTTELEGTTYPTKVGVAASFGLLF